MPAASRRESKGRASTGGSAQAKESGSRRGGVKGPVVSDRWWVPSERDGGG